MAFLDNLERGQQLVAKQGIAVTRVGQRRQRTDDMPDRLVGPIVRFHCPDAQDDPALRRTSARPRRAARSVRCFAPPARDAPRRNSGADIDAEGLALFRLAGRRRYDTRVGLDAGKGRVERSTHDAARLRVRTTAPRGSPESRGPRHLGDRVGTGTRREQPPGSPPGSVPSRDGWPEPAASCKPAMSITLRAFNSAARMAKKDVVDSWSGGSRFVVFRRTLLHCRRL